MIPRRSQIYSALEHHLPPAALAYGVGLWEATPFVLRLPPKRQTKLGDYRFEPRQRWHIISVNRDLPPYPFLVTYVHEIAHLVTFEQHRGHVMPHGVEWKNNFKALMQPLLTEAVFPQPLLGVLARHMRNPKASSYADPSLIKALYPENEQDEADGQVPLNRLEIGSQFVFRKKTYQLLAHRRTRSLVVHTESQRRYLIAQQALVAPVEGA
ncbi:MAG TPA: hypothetical protein DCE41_22115 [Cytophagales bacterium]|nr:hypothetical protein [Cytophagales bacterium]HAA24413.1 hypothetical protein [Cytophagales bacterium]HAP59685.1 hypothetical protein [Cytophagales bacterium]